MQAAPIEEPPRKAVLLDRLANPFDSVKKPWKKSGGGESNQMVYLTERLLKLEIKHKMSKKHGKKRSRDSSDSDSGSD
jgi:hypothetical protein